MTKLQISNACICMILLGTLLCLLIRFVYEEGVEEGRSQFHQELLNELDAKGGAPVLLYPPKGE